MQNFADKYLGDTMKRRSKKVILTAAAIGLLGIALWSYNNKRDLVMAEEADKVVLTVDDVDLTLGDIAFYVAYQELKVEKQARIYDYYDPKAYWNLHTDGEFVKVAAKRAVIEMAVHDEIFCRMAEEEGVELTAEEEELLISRQQDFWSDLTEEQQEKLGVTQEEINLQIRKAALAEKYQNIIAKRNHSDYNAYGIGELPYEIMLKEHDYRVHNNVWNRIRFGDVILTH